MHGQSDQQRLLQPARQREALDRFAGDAVAGPLAGYRRGVRRAARASTTELAELTTRARERAQEADLLRFGLDEIEAVDPQPGEDDRARRRGGAARARRRACGPPPTPAHDALLGVARPATDEGPTRSALVAAARPALERRARHDPALAALADRLAEVGYLLADVAADLASYAAALDADPARLAAVQERRAALTRLTRKYGDDVDARRGAAPGPQRAPPG